MKKLEEQEKRRKMTEEELEDYLREELREYFKRSAASVGLGVCANAHKVFADKDGAGSETCLKLVQVHSDAVDYPKTGVPATMGRELKPATYPVFMDKPDKQEHHGDTVLTKCWEQCPNVSLKRFYVAGEQSAGARFRRRGKQEKKRGKRGGRTEEVRQAVQPKGYFLVPGWEEFKDEAQDALEEYNREVLRLMRTFQIHNEAERG